MLLGAGIAAIRALLRFPASSVRTVLSDLSIIELEIVAESLGGWAAALSVPALALLRSRPIRFAILISLGFCVTWVLLIALTTRGVDAYRGRRVRGLFLRRRPARPCKYCGGFGVVRCDLCNATGFRIYEKKFVYTDPCPKCMARRWQYCKRCGGSGDRGRRWGPLALPKVLHALFPG